MSFIFKKCRTKTTVAVSASYPPSPFPTQCIAGAQDENFIRFKMIQMYFAHSVLRNARNLLKRISMKGSRRFKTLFIKLRNEYKWNQVTYMAPINVNLLLSLIIGTRLIKPRATRALSERYGRCIKISINAYTIM